MAPAKRVELSAHRDVLAFVHHQSDEYLVGLIRIVNAIAGVPRFTKIY
jgi:hypothetical protein